MTGAGRVHISGGYHETKKVTIAECGLDKLVVVDSRQPPHFGPGNRRTLDGALL